MEHGKVAPAWTAWAFAAATLLGAFLLFQVQPLVGKFILPWFGGATAVWTTCMLFFQIALFGGYAYSHLMVGRLSLRSQVVVHCLLLLAAVAVLPIVPSSAWKPTGDAAPTLVILLLLTATVGLPYFVLSTTSPLIQAWFSRSFPGRMPYRLYALSNLGSFLALLSYPFVFEPAFSLATQARLWSWVFLVYVVLAALGGIAVWRLRLAQSTLTRSVGEAVTCDPRLRFGLVSGSTVGGIQNACEAPQGSSTATGWLQRVLWLLLPACASLVLLATTNHVCQDVAAVPLLWIVPLSLYLLTFIICFDHPRWYVRPLWAGLAVLGIAAVMGSDKMLDWITEPYQHEGMVLTYAHQLCLHFGTMFLICMVCHGELVRLRPAPRRLTEFYLLLSAGGRWAGQLPAWWRRSCSRPSSNGTSACWPPMPWPPWSCSSPCPGAACAGRRDCSCAALRRVASSPCCSGKETFARRLRTSRGLSTGSGISTAWCPCGSTTATTPSCTVSA